MLYVVAEAFQKLVKPQNRQTPRQSTTFVVSYEFYPNS
jgi:hypothetical protein